MELLSPRETNDEFRVRQKRFGLKKPPSLQMLKEKGPSFPLIQLVWQYLYFDHNLPVKVVNECIDEYLNIVRPLKLGETSPESWEYLNNLWVQYEPYLLREKSIL